MEIADIYTDRPRRESSFTFGGSQSKFSIFGYPRRWLAALTCVSPVVSYASAPDGPNFDKFSLWRRIAEDLGDVELITIVQILARPNSYNILDVTIFRK